MKTIKGLALILAATSLTACQKSGGGKGRAQVRSTGAQQQGQQTPAQQRAEQQREQQQQAQQRQQQAQQGQQQRPGSPQGPQAQAPAPQIPAREIPSPGSSGLGPLNQGNSARDSQVVANDEGTVSTAPAVTAGAAREEDYPITYAPLAAQVQNAQPTVQVVQAPAVTATVTASQVAQPVQQQVIVVPARQQDPARSTTAPQTTTDRIAGQQGAGWPAGVIFAKEALRTGAVDKNGQSYTDAKDDSILSVLVERMNEIERLNPKFREDSQLLINAIEDIELEINNGRQINAKILLNMEKDGETYRALPQFTGYVVDRRAQLTQFYGADRAETTLQVSVYCADASDRTCNNAVVQIDQIVDGRLCRRALAVHRRLIEERSPDIGDGEFTISREEYLNANRSGTLSHRTFLKLLANTLHYNNVIRGVERLSRNSGHYLEYLGVRSFAVAYGRSGASIIMNRANQGIGRGSELRFEGDLIIPQQAGVALSSLKVRTKNWTPVPNSEQDERFDQTITRAEIIDNDGRGRLTLRLKFQEVVDEDKSSEMRLNITSHALQVLDLDNLQRLVPSVSRENGRASGTLNNSSSSAQSALQGAGQVQSQAYPPGWDQAP